MRRSLSVPALLAAPLALAIAACMPTPPPAGETPRDAPAAAADAAPAPATPAGRLDAWHWYLAEAADADGNRIDALFGNAGQPLQLDFKDGRVSVSGGCNRIGGSYEQDGGALRVGALAQTQMACPQPLMDQDAAIGRVLEGELALATTDSDPPRLELTAADGSRLAFTGAPTADTRFGGPGERVFLEVAAQREACHHPLIADMQCLRVREVSYDEAGIKAGEPGEWQFLYEDIEGFEHRPGVRNVVRVHRYRRDPAPADASSIVYVHDMTVESAIE